VKTWLGPLRDMPRLAGLFVLAAVGVAVTVALFWPITDLIAAHDVGQVTAPLRMLRLQMARDAARGRLLQLGTGLFAAAALVYTARNFTLSREGQVTDRYTKAVEQVGSKELDVKIGGIYALERVARDSARDHPTVMEVLAAFVREHSQAPWPPPQRSRDAMARTTRPDVQAAVTVIGRRNPRNDRQTMDLSSVVLPRANAVRAHLPGADLFRADLFRANLSDGDLTEANLDSADLTSANLSGANLTAASLFHAIMDGADLTSANLSRANLTSANLSRANLTHADLRDAELTDARFPQEMALPDGWIRSESGRLKRAP
jgi:hypothetical protein